MNFGDFTVCVRQLGAITGGRIHPLTLLLREAGYSALEVEDGPLDLAGDGVVLIVGNANWFPRIRHALERCRRAEAQSTVERPYFVIWHSEPLPPPRASGLPRPWLHVREIVKILLHDRRATDVYTNAWCLRSLSRKGLPDLLIVSTASRQEFLAEQGIHSHWVPLGYSSNHGYDMGLDRDIDVLFLGTMDVPRRKRMIQYLRQAGIDLTTAGNWFDPALWGENRTHLLNRTKIFMNIQRFAGEFSGLRMIHGMANRTMVVSEPMYKPDPYLPGQHFVSAPVEQMPDAIRYYLTHEREREEIATAGHQFVTQELTMERSLTRILELIRENV